MTTQPHSLARWQPAKPPPRAPIHGETVTLRPFAQDEDAGPLFAASHGPDADPELWTYLPYGPFADDVAFREWMTKQATSDDPLFLTIVDRDSGQPVGALSWLAIVPEHGTIEIGHIWFSAKLQRSRAATETIYLLMRLAFETLGYRRLEWKCDAANARSCRAAERFGFTHEGVFRQHRIVKGRNRDTAWYSIIDGEWPALRQAFEAWLAPDNHDPQGRQRRPLRDFRESSSAS